jgi:hypothetical protein
MLSVVGVSDQELEDMAAAAVKERGAGTVCQLANYLFPMVSKGRLKAGKQPALKGGRL